MKLSLLSLSVAVFAATLGCVGLDAGSTYPGYSSSRVQKQLLTPENRDDPSISLGGFKIREEVCDGIDTHTMLAPLAHDDFARFLNGRRVQARQAKARGNLFWFDFAGADPREGDTVRLRLAVLKTAEEAADELHKSLLEHGPGWWGLRRSNLSILAPKASVGEAVAFALRHKLVCWGMMMMADADDVYVVPGPYMEL
jgi:hypothetical protein